ncbi:hypothetical protein Hdeb2414_s0012g00394891 [Helianthus debilis subsp. tardiflorus]
MICYVLGIRVLHPIDIFEDNGGSESLSFNWCFRCCKSGQTGGWSFSRDNKRICGTVEGYTKVINDVAVFDSDDDRYSGFGYDDDDEQRHFDYGDDEEKEMMTPGPKIEKKIIKESGSSADGVEEKPNRSKDYILCAATEFSDTGISPSVTSDVKKWTRNLRFSIKFKTMQRKIRFLWSKIAMSSSKMKPNVGSCYLCMVPA